MRNCDLALAPVLSLRLPAGLAMAPLRAHLQFEERLLLLRAVTLMPRDIKVFSLSAGCAREQMDGTSETAWKNFVASLEKGSGGIRASP